MSIIDAHVHVYEKGYFGDIGSLISQMDEYGINKAVVIALPGICSNTSLLKFCEGYPDRLFGMVYPNFSKFWWKNDLRRNIAQEHCVGIKIHPRFQKIELDNSKLDAVFEMAREFNLPVEVDVFPIGKRLNSHSLNPFAIHPYAQKYRDVNIILAHSGAPFTAETMLLASSNSNIYLDISLFLKFFKNFSVIDDFIELSKRIGPDRIIYGSDYPMYSMNEYLLETHRVLHAFSDLDKEKILSKNAMNLFSIPD